MTDDCLVSDKTMGTMLYSLLLCVYFAMGSLLRFPFSIFGSETKSNLGVKGLWLLSLTLLSFGSSVLSEKVDRSSPSDNATHLILDEGRIMTLRCPFNDKPPSAPIWIRNGKLVISDSRTIVAVLGNHSVVWINGVRDSDAGTFECLDNDRHVQERVMLIVLSTWVLKGQRNHETVLEGATARLRCSFSKDGPSEGHITWYQNDEPIISRSRHTVFAKKRSSELVIRNVQLSDEGIIECKGGGLHSLNKTKDEILLEVHTRPKIVLEPPHTKEEYLGVTVTFFCHVTGKPYPKIKWMKISSNGVERQLGTEQDLILANITYNDSGAYHCLVSNDHGKVKSITKLLVKDPEKKSVVILPTKEEFHYLRISFRRAVKSLLSVTCHKGGKTIRVGHRFYIMLLASRFFYLIINSINVEDNGRYTCSFRSKDSSQILLETSSLLEVYGPPPRVSNLNAVYNCTHVKANFQKPYNSSSSPLDGFEAKLWSYDMILGVAVPVPFKNLGKCGNYRICLSVGDICTNHTNTMALELASYGPYGTGWPVVANLQPEQKHSSPSKTRNFVSFPQSEFLIKSNVTTKRMCTYHKMRKSVAVHKFMDSFTYQHRIIYTVVRHLAAQNFSVELGSVKTQNAFSLRLNVSGLGLVTAVQQVTKMRHAINDYGLVRVNHCFFNVSYGCMLGRCENITLEDDTDSTVTPSSRGTGNAQNNAFVVFGCAILLQAIFFGKR
eukprot:m.308402 g.308402  ORF g.308402 m.308402 type:complete len:723 (+) comp43947_c0_seq1:3-2171(+)